MRLLAKNVEYRYQSAFGLKADLENCLAHLDEIQNTNFKLGQKTLGIQLLGETAWDKHYEMAFELHKEQGECQFLCGKFNNSEQSLAIALEKARSKFDKANIYVIKLAQLSAQGQYYQAVAYKSLIFKACRISPLVSKKN